jgi:hypothetical protein
MTTEGADERYGAVSLSEQAEIRRWLERLAWRAPPSPRGTVATGGTGMAAGNRRRE